jgi:hypothetical protein
MIGSAVLVNNEFEAFQTAARIPDKPAKIN